MAHNPFLFNQPGGNPFMQPQLIQPNLHMQALLQQNQKGFMVPQNSILGAPPPRGMPITPFINTGLLRGAPVRGVPGRGPQMQAFRPRSGPAPSDNNEVLGKLAKLVPELNNADKFIAHSKQFCDLLNRGLNKQTADNFYSALETLSANIGKEEFPAAPVWRVFEYAFLKKTLFSGNPAHLDNIAKWKSEADVHVRPKGAPAPAPKKHSLSETSQPGAKRARIIPFVKNYVLLDVGQQVEVLQEELVAAKEELRAVREDHKREIDFLYQHLGITPPAPPTPEPEPEIEEEPEPEPEAAEPAAAEASGENAAAETSGENAAAEASGENAAEGTAEGEEAKAEGDTEMGENAGNGETA